MEHPDERDNYLDAHRRLAQRSCRTVRVSGFTMCTAERQRCHTWESHTHSIRSADVKRTRRRRDQLTTVSW
jgi:hypothetical protein